MFGLLHRGISMTYANHATIAAMKTAASADAVALPILSTDGTPVGRLTPFTSELCRDPAIVADLYRWRVNAMDRFLTVFEPTIAKTQGYLDKLVLVDPARILFLITETDGRRVGNIGLCAVTDREAEVDNVIRGERVPPGFMDAAQRTIVRFAFERLGVERVFLRVLADNARAVESYTRLGYRATGAQLLRREDTADGYRLVPDDTAVDSKLQLLRMEIAPTES